MWQWSCGYDCKGSSKEVVSTLKANAPESWGLDEEARRRNELCSISKAHTVCLHLPSSQLVECSFEIHLCASHELRNCRRSLQNSDATDENPRDSKHATMPCPLLGETVVSSPVIHRSPTSSQPQSNPSSHTFPHLPDLTTPNQATSSPMTPSKHQSFPFHPSPSFPSQNSNPETSTPQ
jgi:hypothetical protein